VSPIQVLKQIRYLLRTATWTESPQALVLGSSVYVTQGWDDEADNPVRLPFAIVSLGTQTPDLHDPHLLTQEVIVVLATSVHGDPLGENSLIGGPGAASGRWGKSEGRGLMDLETALLTSIGRMTGADGVPILVSHGAAPAPEKMGEDVHLVHRQYVLSVVCTRADEYPAPQNLVVNVATPGQAALTWDLPPARFDRYAMKVRRASGSTAPVSETAGTDVPVSALATSVTVTGLSAGVHSFALFMGFDDLAATPATAHHYSSQVTGSYRSGTVT
jgi:hypothetical protein